MGSHDIDEQYIVYRCYLNFYKYFGLMMACIGRNQSSLFKLIKYKIVVFDEVYILLHFNIIPKHNGMSPTEICVRCFPTGDGARCGARKASSPEANQQGNTSHLRASELCLLNGAR